MPSVTTRITSKDILIQFLPSGVAATHIQTLTFASGVLGGTFKLRINGELTGAIEVDETTAGNTKINMDAAFDALPNLTAGEINTTGTFPSLTITGTSDKFYRFFIEEVELSQEDIAVNGTMAADTDWTKGTGVTIAAGVASWDGTQVADSDLEQAALTVGQPYAIQYTVSGYTAGNVTSFLGTEEGGDVAANGTYTQVVTSAASVDYGIRGDLDFVGNIDNVVLLLLTDGSELADAHVTTAVSTQGSSLITLSAEASSFSWEESVGTVDVTAISEYARTEIDVDSSMTFDISLFEANSSWAHIIYAGQTGTVFVYQEGKVVGKKYLSFPALIESFSQDFPDHEKVENSISGMRQGEWIVPPNSIYRG